MLRNNRVGEDQIARRHTVSPTTASHDRSVQKVAVTSRLSLTSPVELMRQLTGQMSDVWLVTLIGCVLSVSAYAWYVAHGLTMAYTDAISHMMIARRVLVSLTPGLAQLGTVWLPLHHMLMLPLIGNETLYRDGFAGALPSMVAYVLGAVYLYRTAHLLFASRAAGWVAALTYLLNANVLYMQGTAMTESDMLCASIIAVYYLLSWSRDARSLNLVKAAAAIAVGTLVRYDSWALALAAVPVVAYIAWRRQGRAEDMTLLFGLLAFAGCAAWFIYNGVIFHDPFAFFDGAYSAATQQQSIQASSGLPTHHNLWLSIHVYLQSAVDSIGLPLAILALGGMLWWAYRERLRTGSLVAYLTLVPFAFNVAALFLGISILETPEINLGIPTYFNVRYGMEMVPWAALFLAFLVTRWRVFTPILLGVVMLLCASSSTLMSQSSTPYVVRDPLYGVGSVARSEGLRAGDWLAQHYTGGNVLITYSHDSAIMFDSQVRDTAFVTEANGVYFQQALAAPQSHVTWIIMSPNAGTVNEVTAALAPRQDWRKDFILRTTIGYTQFWERKANS